MDSMPVQGVQATYADQRVAVEADTKSFEERIIPNWQKAFLEACKC